MSIPPDLSINTNPITNPKPPNQALAHPFMESLHSADDEPAMGEDRPPFSFDFEREPLDRRRLQVGVGVGVCVHTCVLREEGRVEGKSRERWGMRRKPQPCLGRGDRHGPSPLKHPADRPAQG